ncbi:MAG: tripartite tricarboxylate transporter TctB family protein [Deferrisomatales bacterium]|nr:tripartite tricarboxylate transporter TctB family protein [Deferrisomatales bacterium]
MTSVNKRPWVVTDAVVFDVLLLVFFVTFAVTSFQYNVRARSIPLAIGLLGGAMMTLQLLADALPRVGARLRFISQGGLLSRPNALAKRREPVTDALSSDAAPVEKAAEEPVTWFRVFRMVVWLFGFIALLAWTHYLIAVGVFTFLVVVGEAKESWVRALILTLCVCGSFYLLFNVVLGAQL